MNDNVLKNIKELIDKKEINEAQFEIAKLGQEYHKN